MEENKVVPLENISGFRREEQEHEVQGTYESFKSYIFFFSILVVNEF